MNNYTKRAVCNCPNDFSERQSSPQYNEAERTEVIHVVTTANRSIVRLGRFFTVTTRRDAPTPRRLRN